jgi:protein-S-isoprenylcysteine O-methyltransferase Ste14
MRWYAYGLVIVQFACLGVLIFSGPLLPAQPVLALLAISGVLLGVWGVVAMGIGRVEVLPIPRRDAQIVERGPYRLIRHPMYSGLLIFGLALVLAEPSWWRALIWGIFVVDLVLKLRFEERLLAERFPGYGAYQQRTWRLIPWIY